MNRARVERLEAKKQAKIIQQSETTVYNSIYKEAKRLSNIANSRFQSLRKQGFGNLKDFKLFESDIKQFNKKVYTQEGARKTLTANKQMTASELKRVIDIARSFLSSGKSTKTEIITSDQYKKAYKSFSKNLGIGISAQEWSKFVDIFNNKMYKDLYRLLGQQLNYLVVDENNKPSTSKLEAIYNRYLEYSDETNTNYNNYSYLIGD